MGRLREDEAIGKVVSRGVGVTERRQIEGGLDELQDAAEIVSGVRYVRELRIGRYDNQRHAEAVDVSRSPAHAVIDDFGRDVIVPAAPIVPGDDDRGVGPIGAVADRVDDRRHPGWTAAVVERA